MKIIFWTLLLIFLLVCCRSHHAQVPNYFIRGMGSVGTDGGVAVAHDLNNNIITTGYFNAQMEVDSASWLSGSGGSDIYINKYDADGNLLWAKKAGGGGFDRPSHLACQPGGEFFLTGFFSGTAYFGTTVVVSNGLQDFFVAKYNSNGDNLWVRQGGGMFNDIGNNVAFDINGNVIVTGQFAGAATFGTSLITSMPDPITLNPSVDLFIAKYDASGNLLWLKQGASKFTDRGIGVTTNSNGEIYITGQFSDTIQFVGTYPNNLYNAVFILKLDPAGNETWFQKIAGGITNNVHGISTSNIGNLLLTGYFKGHPILFGTNNYSINSNYDYGVFILELDPSGDFNWVKTFGSDCDVNSKSISIDDSSNIYIAGNFKCRLDEFAMHYGEGTFNSVGFHDTYIAKFNPTGDFQWARNYGGQFEDEVRSISVNEFYQPVITGSYEGRLIFPVIDNSFFNFFDAYELGWNYSYQSMFCNEPGDWEMFQIKSKGLRDAFIAKPVHPSVQPYYYYYNAGDSACTRPYVKVQIAASNYDYSLDIPEIKACSSAVLKASTNTSRYSNIWDQQNTSPGPRFNYLWSTGAVTKEISVLQSGSYWVRITSIDSCFVSSDTVTVTIYPLPPRPLITDSQGINVNADSTVTIQLCKPDSLTLSAISLVFPSVFSWHSYVNVVDSNAITLNQSNNYLVNQWFSTNNTLSYSCRITDSNGCINSNYIDVVIDSALKVIKPGLVLWDLDDGIPVQGDTVRMCDLVNFHVVLGVYDSLTSLQPSRNPCFYSIDFIRYATYTWSITPSCPNIFTGTCNQEREFNIPGGGWYTVSCIMIRESPCSMPDTFYLERTFFVILNPVPMVATNISGNTVICPGDSVLLTASGGPYFHWYFNAPFSNSVFISDSSQVYADSIGEYQVIVSDTNSFGCYAAATDFIIITYPDPPLVTINPSTALICPGDSVQLTAQATGNFVWYGPTGIFGSNSPIAYASIPGIYYCVVDSGNCSGISTEMEIYQYSTPYIDVTPLNIICPGETVEINVFTNEGSAIQWLPPLSGSSLNQIISQAGTYTCSVLSCGITTIDSVHIIASSVSASISPTGPIEICDNDSVLLTVNPGMIFYEWNPETSANPQLTVVEPGNYFVITMDNYGCTTTSNTVSVSFLQGPIPPQISSNSPVCSGDTLWLNASNISGNQFSWLLPSGQFISDSLFIIHPSHVFDAGDYYTYVSNGICSVSQSIDIVVDTLIFDEIFLSGLPCPGTTLTISTPQFENNLYTWVIPSQSIVEGTFLNIDAFDLTDSGWYVLTIATGGCQISDSILVIAENCTAAFPDIFTPNQDGFNDYFDLSSLNGTLVFFKVYDRWGSLVFETSYENEKWNGTKMNTGAECPNGAYYFILELKEGSALNSHSGVLQLMR